MNEKTAKKTDPDKQEKLEKIEQYKEDFRNLNADNASNTKAVNLKALLFDKEGR